MNSSGWPTTENDISTIAPFFVETIALDLKKSPTRKIEEKPGDALFSLVPENKELYIETSGRPEIITGEVQKENEMVKDGGVKKMSSGRKKHPATVRKEYDIEPSPWSTALEEDSQKTPPQQQEAEVITSLFDTSEQPASPRPGKVKRAKKE